MSEQPVLPRPVAGERATLSSTLPPRFFDFQDQLRLRAKELAQAAGKKNNGKLSKAYQRLTETCMACHAAYLNGPGSEEEWWPTDGIVPKDPK